MAVYHKSVSMTIHCLKRNREKLQINKLRSNLLGSNLMDLNQSCNSFIYLGPKEREILYPLSKSRRNKSSAKFIQKLKTRPTCTSFLVNTSFVSSLHQKFFR